MRERPPHLSDADVLAAVREHWDDTADSVKHLPLGFGAHHWRVGELFVTLDMLGRRHSRVSLEATYAAAAALAEQGLEFVLAGVPARGGTFTVPLGDDGSLSATPWRTGRPGDGSFSQERAAETAGFLDRLHATAPPPGLRAWCPLVGAGLADKLAARTADYHRVAARTDPATWVPTHGEPGTGNQLATSDGVLLVDWESLMVAPPSGICAPSWMPVTHTPGPAVGFSPSSTSSGDSTRWRSTPPGSRGRTATPRTTGSLWTDCCTSWSVRLNTAPPPARGASLRHGPWTPSGSREMNTEGARR